MKRNFIIITTYKKPDKKVTKITVNPSTKDLTVGETAQLTVTIEPSDATNKSVTWSSDNANVTVDQQGNITAVTAGSSIITATAKDGSGIKGQCTVTVNDKA